MHVQVHGDTGPPPETPNIRAFIDLIHEDAQLTQGRPTVRHDGLTLPPQGLVHGGKVEGATTLQRVLNSLQQGGEVGKLIAEVPDPSLGCAQGLVQPAEGVRDLTSQAIATRKTGRG